MIEEGWCPGLCAMAVVALIVGRKMAGRLSRSATVVVAALAGAIGLEMVDSRDRHPRGRPMAGIAALGSRDMGRRLRRRPYKTR